ncbi:uncharacterized protein B0H64DRAFT_149482 [Chaetomium fimeti]|uniref:Uncharacterized protein n=1 Tax=Chaetomium fimeti TaxID=1854472 RepID=A0AAE0HFQ9_9PEZI|nr:hypothetical protein B0H64DRAFT_149482 [Chaetomium fimeti]
MSPSFLFFASITIFKVVPGSVGIRVMGAMFCAQPRCAMACSSGGAMIYIYIYMRAIDAGVILCHTPRIRTSLLTAFSNHHHTVSASALLDVFSSEQIWQRTFCFSALWIVCSCLVRSYGLEKTVLHGFPVLGLMRSHLCGSPVVKYDSMRKRVITADYHYPGFQLPSHATLR